MYFQFKLKTFLIFPFNQIKKFLIKKSFIVKQNEDEWKVWCVPDICIFHEVLWCVWPNFLPLLWHVLIYLFLSRCCYLYLLESIVIYKLFYVSLSNTKQSFFDSFRKFLEWNTSNNVHYNGYCSRSIRYWNEWNLLVLYYESMRKWEIQLTL